ncbi:MAG: permease [Chloroflexi bacterium]|nr:permease [Chloroflexota bacterium]
MRGQVSVPSATRARRGEYLLGFGLLLVIAVVGLFIVKWSPYWARAFAVASSHTLGNPIVYGTEATPPPASVEAALDYAQRYFQAVWQAMLLGLLLAATLDSVVPRDWLARVLGSRRFSTAVLGGVLALPGMMCSCCSVPVVAGLYKRGASIGCAVAFFLGNPTLNPAVLVFMLFTLGWPWVVLRLVLGLVLVFGGAWLAVRLTEREAQQSSASAVLLEPEHDPRPWPLRWLGSLVRFAAWLLPEYIILVGVLGAARAFLFPALGTEIGNNLPAVVGMAIAGTLFVIPTAGEIPIVQTMLAYGVGAGPAGALLLTLAPLSLPSLVMLGRTFPTRVLLALGLLCAAVGMIAGLLAMALGL